MSGPPSGKEAAAALKARLQSRGAPRQSQAPAPPPSADMAAAALKARLQISSATGSTQKDQRELQRAADSFQKADEARAAAEEAKLLLAGVSAGAEDGRMRTAEADIARQELQSAAQVSRNIY